MPIQPSMIFMGAARSLPYKGAPERCFTRVGLRLTYTQTRLHRLPRDKHSNIRKSRPQKVLQHWAQDKTWAKFSALEVAVWVMFTDYAFLPKQPSLEMKIWPKQHLGSFPSEVEVTKSTLFLSSTKNQAKLSYRVDWGRATSVACTIKIF